MLISRQCQGSAQLLQQASLIAAHRLHMIIDAFRKQSRNSGMVEGLTTALLFSGSIAFPKSLGLPFELSQAVANFCRYWLLLFAEVLRSAFFARMSRQPIA